MARDTYQEVTDRVIAALEAGKAPWQTPWTTHTGGRPVSMSTGKPYRGANVWLTGMTALERGYTSPWWGTFKQIQARGGNVRVGENRKNGRGATQVILWKELTVADKDNDGKPKKVLLLRDFSVFNADQCDNLPERYYPAQSGTPVIEPITSAENALNAYLTSGDAASMHYDEHGRAYYNPLTDEIHMPSINEFRSAGAYYSTAFHEATHSTGHPSRLDREGGKQFGDHAYGREELIAEMGAALLLAETNTESPSLTENNAAYLRSWIRTLKEDNRAVIHAASRAEKAADLILAPSRTLVTI